MKEALNYDAFTEDKGVFWIDFESVLTWFSTFQLNWNPDRLPQQKTIFDFWQVAKMSDGLTSSIMNNP
jgi:hypothetical protein